MLTGELDGYAVLLGLILESSSSEILRIRL